MVQKDYKKLLQCTIVMGSEFYDICAKVQIFWTSAGAKNKSTFQNNDETDLMIKPLNNDLQDTCILSIQAVHV